MVTHDASAAQYGDRLLRLKDGVIDNDSAIVRVA
jgi:ABC-type lipoprotein export system ATPase subunit